MPTPLALQHGDLLIDLARYRVLVSLRPLALSYREYALLVYLASRPGHLVSRRQLLEEGMGRHDLGGLRMVDEHLRHVKSALERDGHRFLEEVGDGYRFIRQE